MPTSAIPRLRRTFDAFTGSIGGSSKWRRACGSGSTPRAANARRRPRNCSPTARMPGPRRSKSAIRISRPKGAGASRDAARVPATDTASALRSSRAGSTATSTSSRPARSRTACRSSNIFQDDATLLRHRARRLGAGGRNWAISPINVDGVADYVRATIEHGDGAGAAHSAAAPARRPRGAVGAGRRPRRGRMGQRAGSRRRRSRRRPTATRMVNASLAFHPFAVERQQHRPVGEQYLRRRRRGATPACSRIMRRSPAATSG